MADPATVTMAVRAAVVAASDPRARKVIGCVIAAVLSPLILIVALFMTMASGAAEHNSAALDLCFNNSVLPARLPEDYRLSVTGMRESFAEMDQTLLEIGKECEWEDGEMDIQRMRSLFFALFFGAGYPQSHTGRAFVDSFVRYERRTRTAEGEDENRREEIYTAAIPLSSLPEIYANLDRYLGRAVTPDEQANATEIYYRSLYGGSIPTYGMEFDKWSDGLPLSSEPFIGADGFCSPLGENWSGMVTSEFGYRKDPFTGKSDGHSGIDLAAPKGTPIRAALDGTVQFVRHSTTGYGRHLSIDHGGGFVTLYAHCSNILISEGQAVSAGDIIAEVGSTGRSTGNHLHFEVKIREKKQNPRSYLPR